MYTQKILVTRHPGLVDYLAQKGYTFDKVISHATSEDVLCQEVWGVLPLNLIELTNRFVSVELTIPAELRGVELTAEDIETLNPKLVEYRVASKSYLNKDYSVTNARDFYNLKWKVDAQTWQSILRMAASEIRHEACHQCLTEGRFESQTDCVHFNSKDYYCNRIFDRFEQLLREYDD